MKIGIFNYYEIYNNNRMFKYASSPIGDDLLYPFVYLYEFAKTKGIKVSTIDTEPLDSYDAIVFLDFPGFKNKYFKKLVRDKFENLYLLMFESKIVRADNWEMTNQKYFKKIFTWADDFVDNKKYFKINYAQKIQKNIYFNLNKKEKLCSMIAGNKMIGHPLELYTERIKAICWFEQNHPEDFDLYGIGWDRYRFKGKLSKFNRLTALTRLLKPKYLSYQGSVESKKETYERYKFAICYENARDIAGYITEKIFDCFFAGCVPIYWGAPNVTDHIPANTFIDRRDFKNYEELYKYIKNMPDKEYSGYLDAIKDFVQSDRIYPFSAEYFAETIVNQVSGIFYD